MQRDWKRGCTTKVKYYGYVTAREGLERMQAREPNKIMHIYHCPECGCLHVGTKGLRAEGEQNA